MAQNAIVPLYQQIKEDIKEAIESGKYKTNEKIPAEPELSEEYSASRITVRRAVEELCVEGYLIKKQGKGTFVSQTRMNRKLVGSSAVRSFTELCESYHMKPGARLASRQIVPVRRDEEKFFGLDSESLLLYIQRVRTADDTPIFLENLFLPYEPFKMLMKENLNDVSMFAKIREVSGHYPTSSMERTLEIARASAEQAKLLGVPLADPLFHLNVHFLDEEGAPLCIGRQYYIGSRYVFEI